MKKITALAALAVATFVIAVSPASAALPNQRTDLKVLLLSANGAEPTTGAWEAALKREGVPYEKKIAANDEAYTAETFAEHPGGRHAARQVPGGDRRDRRTGLRGRGRQLGLRAQLGRVGGAGRLRVPLRHPPDHGLHLAVGRVRPQLPDGER